MSSKGQIWTQIRRTFLSTIARLCCWCDPVTWANQKISSLFPIIISSVDGMFECYGDVRGGCEEAKQRHTQRPTERRGMAGGGGGLKYVSRWYNGTGWLGVKHQLTYLLTYLLTPSLKIPFRAGTLEKRPHQCFVWQLVCSDATSVQISAEES